jgi:hypothetical protein
LETGNLEDRQGDKITLRSITAKLVVRMMADG